jgi:hypothetical protein
MARTILGLAASTDDITPNLITEDMAEASARFLDALAQQPSPSAIALSTEIYCLAYIAIAKQGNITDAKLVAICNAVSEETGRTVSLTSEDIKSFSNSFKPYITADNAQAICEGLKGKMHNCYVGLECMVYMAACLNIAFK